MVKFIVIIETHEHDLHSDHKIIRRQLNAIDQDIKTIKTEIDPSKKLNIEHKHSDTTHSAIGIEI